MENAAPTVIIRRGTAGDLPAIGDLWEQLMAFHIARDPRFATSAHARADYLRHVSHCLARSSDHAVLVAVVDGVVAGLMVARVEYGGPIFQDPNFGYVVDACVDENHRRLGLGRGLFEAAKKWFRTRGMSNIRVSVASANPLAQAFWRDMGFRPFMERLWYDLDD